MFTPFSVCADTPFSVSHRGPAVRRSSGSGIEMAPVRYCPVSGLFAASLSGPLNTTSPPLSPLPGPISTIQSDMRTASRSCSTTITVLPASRSRRNRPSSRSMSRGCKPMLGSSSTYSVSTSCAPRLLASAMRCASPPESVRAARSIDRYPSPTSRRNRTRARASRKTLSAIFASNGVRVSESVHRSSASTDIALTSAILSPLMRTLSASRTRRLPPHVPQVAAD